MSSVIMIHGFLLFLFLLLHSGNWTGQSQPLVHQGVEEEKVRLGSTPPSCHNSCNACNPCQPVQVPTFPGWTGRSRLVDCRPPHRPAYSQFNSNYKPLEWKCACGARLFTP